MLRKAFIPLGMVFCLVMIVGSLQLSAQQVPDPIPLPTTPVPTTSAAVQQLEEDFKNRVLSLYERPLSEYRVVYLTNSDGEASSALNPQTMLASMGVQVVSDLDSLVNYHEVSPMNVLIIDSSAKSLVDQIWLRNIYQQGTAIAGIQLTIPEMIEMLGDQCTANPNGYIRYSTDEPFYNLYVFALLVDFEEDRAILAEDAFANCDSDVLPNGLRGGFRYLGFGADGPLVTEADYEAFNDRLARAAASLQEMRIEVEYSNQMNEG